MCIRDSSENEKLNSEMTARTNEINVLKSKLGNMETRSAGEIKELRNQISIYEENLLRMRDRMKELEGRIATLTNDNQVLSARLGEKTTEVNALRTRVSNSEKDLTLRVEELSRENDLLRKSKEKEIGDIVARTNDTISRLENEIGKLRARVAEAMNREVVQTSEIERLANIRNELEREVDRMRASLSTIESKYQLEIEEITSEFTSFKKRTQELGELEVRLETERKKHDNQMSLLRQKIFDLENQLALASGEVTRLNGQLEEKLREITELREAVNSTEMVKYGESVKLRAQVEAMKKTHTVFFVFTLT
eukprot:TRINITY_DN4161_c0_g1_i9.p1 TRINITY_DN4161_c0_g1~~TRINITY_DN4161_c0_g1_i9.p1  ORF type:complete len:344 (+),score=131.75 TRINITY_DN4161_c0_g1_i9:108-1034(+)